MVPEITANQMRSARAWLNWSREDLAEKAGVVANTIAAIEKGDGSSEPNARTLAKIMGAFEAAGIELTNDGGVRPRVSRVSYFTGTEGFKQFFDDVYETVKDHIDPNVCVTNVNESLFQKWHGQYDAAHVARMSALDLKPYRALLKENDKNTRTSKYCEFRWVSDNQFADTCVYIYGDKTAFIDFEQDTVIVTLVDSSKVSGSLRRMFDVTWQNAMPVGT
jgi:DNA-binding XRE family transcriptional regulator